MADFFFRAFGTPGIDGPEGPLGGSATQKRTLALIAILAVGGDSGVRRDKALELLWPDSDPDRARHALTQALYQARRAVGGELFLTSGDYLRLDSGVIASDVAALKEALAQDHTERLLEIYKGPFLEGFVLSLSAEFERWMSGQRAHFAERVGQAVDAAAARVEIGQDWLEAVNWLKRLAALEPVRGSVAVRLMRAMAATGDRAGAIRHAQIHSAIVAAELEVPPDPAVQQLEEELRRGVSHVLSPVQLPVEPVQSTLPAEVEITVAPYPGESSADTATNNIPNRQRRSSESTQGWGRAARIAARRRYRRYTPSLWAVLAVSVLILGTIAWRISRQGASDTPAHHGDVLVILPFRVTGGTAVTYLSEGLMDLLITTLPDVTPAMAVDPGVLVRAWQGAGGTPTNSLSLPQALKIARMFRGTQLIGGNVIVADKRLVVTGWLADVSTGHIDAQTTVEGSSDSLTTLVNRLGARLVAVSAGQPAMLADRAMGSARHVRAYLAGLRSYRAGQFAVAARRFESVLIGDTAFAEAAFWLMLAGDRGHVASQRTRGLRLAWSARGALSEADRAYLIAFAGPRYPHRSSDREYMRAWESVVESWPERADAWQELGEILFRNGQVLGIRGARERARRAFVRARILAPDLALPLPYLVQIAALDRDRVGLDSLESAVDADSSDVGDFARWRLAVARGDGATLRRLRGRFARMPLPSLRAIAMATQYEQIDSVDMLPSATTLVRRTISPDAHLDALLALHSAALLQHRQSLVHQTIEEIDDVNSALAQRLRVTDALYATGDIAEAMTAAQQLRYLAIPIISAQVGVRATSDIRDARRIALDRCVAAQWDLLRGSGQPTDTLQHTAAWLMETAPKTDDDAVLACHTLLETLRTVRGPELCRRSALAKLDSLVHDGAPVDELRAYLPLAASRLHRACSDVSGAASVAQMRPYMRGWPLYTGDSVPSG